MSSTFERRKNTPRARIRLVSPDEIPKAPPTHRTRTQTEKLAGRVPLVPAAEQVFLADLNAGLVGLSEGDATEPEEQGRALVRLYLRKYGELPVVAVEQEFVLSMNDPDTGEVLPRPLRGYFDFVLGDGRVIELKTSSRKWGADVSKHLPCKTRGHPGARWRQTR